MKKNEIFTNEEKQIFHGSYPMVSGPLMVKTAVEAGDVIGVDASGNYGKYDGGTYKDVYAVAYEGAGENEMCSAILSGYLVAEFVKTEEIKVVQALKHTGIFIK